MLNKLENRFKIAGHRNIQFVIAYSETNETGEQNSTTDASPQQDTISQSTQTPTMSSVKFETTIKYNITIVRGLTNIFPEFDLLSAYVFDQCGRLAYIIYHPWSSIQRPYLKASILSTIYDAPCGLCNVRIFIIIFL